MFIPIIFILKKSDKYFQDILYNVRNCFTEIELNKLKIIHIFIKPEILTQDYYVNKNTLLLITYNNFITNKSFFKLENKVILITDQWFHCISNKFFRTECLFNKEFIINDFNIMNSFDNDDCLLRPLKRPFYIRFDIDKVINNQLIYIKNQTFINNIQFSKPEIHNITIIINSYSPKKEDLLRSINSCLNQTNVIVSLIIVTVENDITISIVEELNHKDIELVVCLLKDHPGKGPKGIYYQLNQGLKLVKTRFFSYFSSNDIMYPTKSYNEITNIIQNKGIFCFSRLMCIKGNQKGISDFPKQHMNYKTLIRCNFINDCATIDLFRLKKPIVFNYEKCGNFCYYNLWLEIISTYGEGSMLLNDRAEWDYIIEEKSQHCIREKNKDKEERHSNLREFVSYNYDYNIKPRTIIKYKQSNELIWWWHDVNNKKPIEMTVALPALNGEKIIWLALESLKNQINITFAWELIVFEEEGKSKEIVQSYVGLLPGCSRVIYKTITKEDAFYKPEDIKKYNCCSYYTLLEKWISMAQLADKNSRIFVKHATDDYSSSKRLYIHYEHFKHKNCYLSTQPKGYFYNIIDDNYMLYDGNMLEPVYWDKFGHWKIKHLDSNYTNNPSVLIRSNHLNMAHNVSIIKNIQLPVLPLRSGVDGYLFKHMTKLTNKRSEEEKIIFTDDEIDKENWCNSLFTDGFNNISQDRRNYYKKQKYPHFIPIEKNKINLNIPDYILEKLKAVNKN